MNELEKIARAMHVGVNAPVKPTPAWHAQAELSQKYWRVAARAAIEALRRPTEYQSQIGGGVGKYDMIPVAANNPPVGQSIAERCWIAMIDAILSEPQTSSKPLPSLEGQGPELTTHQIQAMERDGK